MKKVVLCAQPFDLFYPEIPDGKDRSDSLPKALSQIPLSSGTRQPAPIALIVEIEFGGGAGAKLKPLGWPGRLTAAPFPAVERAFWGSKS